MIATLYLQLLIHKLVLTAMTVLQASGVQARIDHTRAHEAEADNLGMLNLVKSGFDARQCQLFLNDCWSRVGLIKGSQCLNFCETHPVTTSRSLKHEVEQRLTGLKHNGEIIYSFI